MVTSLFSVFHSLLPLGFYLATIAIVLLSAFWRPHIGVYYLAFFLPLENMRHWLHQFPFGEKSIDVVLVGIFIGILTGRNETDWTPTPITGLLAAWGLLLYVSLCRGSFFLNSAWPISPSDPRVSDWKNYIEFFFFFLAAAGAIRNKRQIAGLLIAMGLCFLLVNREFHGTMSQRDLSSFSYGLRDAGPLGGAGENGLAAFEATSLLFLVAMTGFKWKRGVKWAIIGLIVTGVYCLLFTFSRGGYLAFVAGLVFLGIVHQRKLLFLVGVLLISWQTLLPASVQQRITMTYDQSDGGGDLDQSAQERIDLWADAQRLIRTYPAFGTGFETYAYMGRVGTFRDTHNYYVKIALETGAAGLLVFLFVVWRLFVLGYRLFRRSEDPFLTALGLGFAAMVVGTAIANLFGDRWSYFQVDGWMWLLLGAVVRGLILIEQSDAPTEPQVGFGVAEAEDVLMQRASVS